MGIEKLFPYLKDAEAAGNHAFDIGRRAYGHGKQGIEALMRAIEENPRLASGAAGGLMGAGGTALAMSGSHKDSDEYEEMLKRAQAGQGRGGY